MNAGDALKEALGDAVEEVVDDSTAPFVRVKANKIVEASRVLKERCGVQMLHLISGVDWKDRFEVVYHFARIEPAGDFLTLKVNLPHDDPVLPTLCGEWKSADWLERETWDLMGIRFEGHPHPYRILEVDGAFGAIQVTETLKGDRHETAILGGRTELMSSDAINYRVGITGLWFLRSATNSDDAAYLADHPQRFVSDVREIAVWRDRLQ